MTLLIHRCRAQNNFRMVAAHDDRSEKFLLGEVSFLTGQILGKKLTNPCAIFYVFLQREKNPGFTGKDLVGCSRIRVSQECA